MNIDELLIQVRSPVRYIDREVNAWRKDPGSAELLCALCFPDLYEVGISHLGHQLLYHVLNGKDGVLCDRSYAVWPDLAELMKKNSAPLYGWETKLPLKAFDLVGFTLSNELCYSNVLSMLDLAGIPLRSEQRREGKWPLIIGGGPCASNPEPMADFFDAFFFGEADAAILEIAEVCRKWKRAGDGHKENLLRELAQIPGVYVPSFYRPEFDGKQTLTGIRPEPGAPETIRRRLVPDLNQAFSPTRQLVPFAEAVHDRLVIELARGCTRGCRFCHAGIIYRPYREKSPSKILELCREGLKSTGYEELSLLSLSAGDYCGIEELIAQLIVEHWHKRVAVSLPSLRVNSLTPILLEAIKRVRKTGFTIAPEAGSERLRRALNKQITDSEILATGEKVLSAGWRTLKLYFMVGLPTETAEDLAGIGRIMHELNGMAKRVQPSAQFNLSVSGFIPKPHTAFQWEKQAGISELTEIREQLRREMPRGRVRFRFESPPSSFLEGVFSRAGRELAPAIEQAFLAGARFDGWSEQFQLETWLHAFEKTGINPEAYLRERDENTWFPWEHLDPGVEKSFLRKERARSRTGELTADCRVSGCGDFCGVCDQKEIAPSCRPAEQKSCPEDLLKSLDSARPQEGLHFRYLIKYSRLDDLRFLGPLENNRMFLRAVRRAGLPMRYSQGFHPLPKISFGPMPPVGVESEVEFLEVEILERWPVEQVKDQLQRGLPLGIEILEVKEISLQTPSITQVISAIEYVAHIPDELKDRFGPDRIAAFLGSSSFMIEQVREKGGRRIDLRQKISFMELPAGGGLRFGIINSEGPGVKPTEVVANVFGLSAPEASRLRYRRSQVYFREQRPVSYPESAVRGRPGARPRRRS